MSQGVIYVMNLIWLSLISAGLQPYATEVTLSRIQPFAIAVTLYVKNTLKYSLGSAREFSQTSFSSIADKTFC